MTKLFAASQALGLSAEMAAARAGLLPVSAPATGGMSRSHDSFRARTARGATLIEYVLLAAIIVGVFLIIQQIFPNLIDTAWCRVQATFNTNLAAGGGAGGGQLNDRCAAVGVN